MGKPKISFKGKLINIYVDAEGNLYLVIKTKNNREVNALAKLLKEIFVGKRYEYIISKY